MNFSASGVSLLFMLLGAFFQFLVIYFAVRLALKHDRERATRD
ncbi:hypothetical protein [Streptosporangium sp. 'caverna']|nr:hypothetical protein [Streptosporangium sp. 'caverna']